MGIKIFSKSGYKNLSLLRRYFYRTSPSQNALLCLQGYPLLYETIPRARYHPQRLLSSIDGNLIKIPQIKIYCRCHVFTG